MYVNLRCLQHCIQENTYKSTNKTELSFPSSSSNLKHKSKRCKCAPSSSQARPQEEEREAKGQKNNKNTSKECFRDHSIELIDCVWKAKEKKDKLVTGRRWRTLGSCTLQSCFLTMMPSCFAKETVGPLVNGLRGEEAATTAPIKTWLNYLGVLSSWVLDVMLNDLQLGCVQLIL